MVQSAGTYLEAGMERIRFAISGGLTREQMDIITNDILRLLGDIGVVIENEDVLEELMRHDGVTVDGQTVRYSAALVEEFMRWVRADNADYMLNVPGREKPLVRPPFLCLRVWDPEAQAAREATVADLARAARLLDTYEAEGIPPIHPQDVPPELRQVVAAKTCYENSRGIGSYMQADSIREAEILCELGRAAGRQGPHCFLQIPHSPLRLDANSLGIILDMKRSNNTPDGVAVGGGAMPLAGAVAPLLAPGFLAQGFAEALAAYGTGRLLNEKVRGYCSVFPGTFDMRHSGVSMASPEALLYSLAIRQLHEHFFGQKVGGDFGCMGKTYDAQAAAEKTAAVLTAVLSGATTFTNIGMTPMDEVFHFEGAVIDMEILDYAWRIGRGLGWEDTPTADIVSEGRRDGTFLMHPSTMRFREEIWDPQIFTHEGFNHWTAQGGIGLIEKAAATARERIEANTYHVDGNVQKDLDRILAIAEKDLA